ncbi:hypothetical protein, partial [Streptomyces griseoflavus]|uniref:hypothetical protein n=1 Tax=Streptomyces griseoflavus TaxID=35619 RepID=UPI0001B4B684
MTHADPADRTRRPTTEEPLPGPGREDTGGSWLEPALLAVTAASLTAGGVLWLLGHDDAAGLCWALGTVSAVVPASRLGGG